MFSFFRSPIKILIFRCIVSFFILFVSMGATTGFLRRSAWISGTTVFRLTLIYGNRFAFFIFFLTTQFLTKVNFGCHFENFVGSWTLSFEIHSDSSLNFASFQVWISFKSFQMFQFMSFLQSYSFSFFELLKQCISFIFILFIVNEIFELTPATLSVFNIPSVVFNIGAEVQWSTKAF